MPRAKSVHTVFVVPVIWLSWSPETKAIYFFVGPYKWTLHASIIQPYPGPFSVVPVLYVHIFFLVVYSNQIRIHPWAVWLSGQPWGACVACEVAKTTKVTPSRMAYRIYMHCLMCWLVTEGHFYFIIFFLFVRERVTVLYCMYCDLYLPFFLKNILPYLSLLTSRVKMNYF